MVSDIDFTLRLLLAATCGATIGLERQFRYRTAGLRTNALVASGASIFVLFGEQVATPVAPLQITAYVVSGIGFLGAGVILRQDKSVSGLNTAATLWCSAAIGAQCAAGHVIPAISATLLIILIHVVLRPTGKLVSYIASPSSSYRKTGELRTCIIRVRVEQGHEERVRDELLQSFAKYDAALHAWLSELAANGLTDLQAELHIERPARQILGPIITQLSRDSGVNAVFWSIGATTQAHGSAPQQPRHLEPASGREAP